MLLNVCDSYVLSVTLTKLPALQFYRQRTEMRHATRTDQIYKSGDPGDRRVGFTDNHETLSYVSCTFCLDVCGWL